MRIVYRAESLIDAHLVKDALEAAEIPAYVSGEYLTGAIGQLPVRDLVSVMVPDSRVEEAEPHVQQVCTMLEACRREGHGDDDDLRDLESQPA